MVRFVADLDEFQGLLKDSGDKLVVVDFTASWCGPCQQIGPLFEQMANRPENKNVVFLKVDVDDAGDVSEYCDIKCMPTFQFYKNGNRVDEFSGANVETLKEKLEKHRT
ncbi:thioredoxin b [Takifugu rubripes]|uniref:Thioredoxin n=1 Tax=Takifugu flavidus TaxID=433684 RepID=A0A5C6N8E1_9TELE|nr:thioredoxin-like [Takifugu rubripes]XP_056884789.1 thioredoxin-like [Takifugu flavidus]TWW63395.1 Thioredoxin [Takifugu flavidus]|eukprot:XP_003978604.1 PREDICTED: thioredoxin-like [Takifugu rubripes]